MKSHTKVTRPCMTCTVSSVEINSVWMKNFESNDGNVNIVILRHQKL